MTDIDGNLVAMSAFGTLGFGTLEPGSGAFEEQISFTGITQNANGTATLTGVSSVTFLSPYTATSGLLKTHAGSTTFVISNTSGFYDTFANKNDDETIVGNWQFPNPTLPANPVLLAGIQNGTYEYFVDSGAANAMVITPAPALASYVAGQKFIIKVAATNTGSVTLNVNGLGVKNVTKQGAVSLGAGDILIGQLILVDYDGTQFQLVGGSGGSGGSGAGGSFSGASVKLTAPTGSSPIAWDSEYFDTDSYHNNVTNNTRLTIPATGNYLVAATVAIVTVAGNSVSGIRLLLNGATTLAQAGGSLDAPNSGGFTISGAFNFTAGDYIEITHFSNGGGVTVNTESVFSIIQSGTLLSKKITVASADVLQLNATPITLVAAPAAGHAIEVTSVAGRIVFNSVAYTTNLNLQVKTGGTALASNSDLLADAATTIRQFALAAGTITSATATTLSVATGNPAAGNSPIDIYITYRDIIL